MTLVYGYGLPCPPLKELRPLMASRGGPIVAVQIENEYGYYGADHVYLG